MVKLIPFRETQKENGLLFKSTVIIGASSPLENNLAMRTF